MNLEYLRTFVSIIEHGSLSAAARAKRISQPAVTKQVQRLESEIGLPLMVRASRRPLELTPAGERVLAFARETTTRFEELERELAGLKEIDPGTLDLAASTIPGEHVLPGLLADFRKAHPDVDVRVTISDTDDVAARLLAGNADIGMIGSVPRTPGLRLERLVRDKVVLAVPSGHPFAEREAVSFDELRGQPLILREEGSGTRRSVELALEAAGLSLPTDSGAMTLGSTQSVLQAVAQGLGLGFVSARAAAQGTADGHLACVRLSGVDLIRDLLLAVLPGRIGDPLIVRFMDFAQAWVAEEAGVPGSPDSKGSARSA
jgi:DNA-binding transcriptional LysR family regulator